MASSIGPGKMITDGLVLHLDAANTKSYPGSGTTWTDLSPTATSGSLTNGPVFTSTVNGSIFFDGTNDHIRIPDSNIFNFTALTALVWFNSAIFPAFSQYRLVNHQESTNRSWGIEMGRGDYIGTGTSSDMLLFCHSSNNTTFRILSGATKLSQSRWYHTAFSTDGTNMKLYLNGVLDNSTASLASSPYSTIAGDIGIGIFAENFSSFPWSGSIASVSIYNRVLSDAEIFNIYETTSERFNRPTIVTDDDARNFLNSANISSETQQRAVNDLVVDLKNVGLWGKMKAIYPFVGGTATTHKWNLKDPRDVNAAFRLQFNGGWTHSSTGAKPNGTTGYADTFFIANNVLSLYNGHLSYYSRTSGSSLGEVPIGVGSNSGNWNGREVWAIRFLDGYYAAQQHSQTAYPSATDYAVANETSMLGYWLQSRRTSDATTLKLFKNGNSLANATTNPSGQVLNTFSVFIGALRNMTGVAPYAYNYTNAESSFASIGDGLTDTDAANLYTIVQKYQTTLGRQV